MFQKAAKRRVDRVKKNHVRKLASLLAQDLSKQRGNQWKRMSKRERARYDHRCAVCGVAPGKGRLHCHEAWEYDDATCVQKLSGFIALCDLCHRVKHGVWIKHLATWPL